MLAFITPFKRFYNDLIKQFDTESFYITKGKITTIFELFGSGHRDPWVSDFKTGLL